MDKMTEDEFDEYVSDLGLNKPTKICEKCGQRNYYLCFECDPNALKNLKLKEFP